MDDTTKVKLFEQEIARLEREYNHCVEQLDGWCTPNTHQPVVAGVVANYVPAQSYTNTIIDAHALKKKVEWILESKLCPDWIKSDWFGRTELYKTPVEYSPSYGTYGGPISNGYLLFHT